MIRTLTGNDDFARMRRLEELTKSFIKTHGLLNVERFDAEESEASAIIEATMALSLLAENKLVIIKQAAAQKALLEQLLDNQASIPKQTVVILVDKAFDKRAGYYKKLQNQTEFERFDDARGADIAGWVVERVRREGGTINPADARFLVERVGSEKTLLANEVVKLVLYSPKVAQDTIELLSEPTAKSSIFQLVDAAFRGDNQTVIRLYEDQRKQRIEPLAILAMIAWQLQVLAFIKTAAERSSQDIAASAKINPFVVRKSEAIARRLSMSELKNLIERTLQLDIKLKSGAVEPDQSMRHFLLSFK